MKSFFLFCLVAAALSAAKGDDKPPTLEYSEEAMGFLTSAALAQGDQDFSNNLDFDELKRVVLVIEDKAGIKPSSDDFIQSLFDDYDANYNSVLGYNELLNALHGKYDAMNDEDKGKLLKYIQSILDKYSKELCSNKELRGNLTEAAFAFLDLNGDDYLSMNEVNQDWGLHAPSDFWSTQYGSKFDDGFRKYDKNHDYLLTYDEIKPAMEEVLDKLSAEDKRCLILDWQELFIAFFMPTPLDSGEAGGTTTTAATTTAAGGTTTTAAGATTTKAATTTTAATTTKKA